MTPANLRDLAARIHPEQFRRRRPFVRLVERVFAGRRDSMATMSDMQTISNGLIPAYNDAIMQVPFEQRPEGTIRVKDEVSLAVHYGLYYAQGRQVFSFPDSLVEAFRQTDIEGVPADALRLPFPSVYLYFGPQLDLDLYGNGLVVDGAYMTLVEAEGKGYLQFWLTTVPAGGGSENRGWPFDYLANHYMMAVRLAPGKTIVEVIESTFRKSLEDALERARTEPETLGTPWGEVANRSGKTALESAAALDNGFPVLRESLRLIINGVCFLTAYPEHVSSSWGEGAPPGLVAQASSGATPKRRRVAEVELREQGYVLVKIGRMDGSPRPSLEGEPASGGKVRTHWRRGHWRNQAVGSGRKDHRLIWIMPILVNKDSGGEAPGHIYIV